MSARTARDRSWLRRPLVSTASVAGGVVLWWIVASIVRDPVVLPSPIDVFGALVKYMSGPYPSQGVTLWQHAAASLTRIAVGFGLGSIIGIAIGSLMAGSKAIRHIIDPFIELSRPLPPLAFIPILIVWFGIGEVPKVLLILIGVVPVMIIATVTGLDNVEPELIHASRSLGGSERYTMMHVRVRAALPSIVTGMRLAVGMSWTSIVAAEMIAAQSGLGYVILQAGNYLDTSLIFAAILVIGVLGLLMDGILRLVLRFLDPAGAARRV
ncbi:MAG: binding-protein-dependent transport system inner rane component [Microbacteriaceae bacterium]|nr:binding-protein-dependent transport system inner rane component [Microbacteriaceae bacterium]